MIRSLVKSTVKSAVKRALGIDTPERGTYPSPEPAPPPPAEPAAKAAPAEAPHPDPVEVKPVLEEVAPAEKPAAKAAAPAKKAAAKKAAPKKAAAPPKADFTMEQVQEVLDDMVRPALQGDGGDISLIKIEDNSIYVRLVGACNTCPSSVMTMKMGVEALLKEEFPTMKDLIQLDAGTIA